MDKYKTNVFFDPSGKREVWVKKISLFIILVLMVIYGLIILGYLFTPALPIDNIYTKAKRTSHQLSLKNSSIGKDTQVFVFYVNWDPGSFQSLQKNINNISYIVPEWLHLKEDLSIIEETDPKVIDLAKKNQVPIIPLINNFTGGWQKETVHKLLSNPQKRTDFIDKLLNLIKANEFQGINIDFEAVNKEDKLYLNQFMAELSRKFHRAGLLVTQDVPAQNPAFDYKKLAEYNDYVIAMLYDEYSAETKPGPIASKDWFVKMLGEISIPAQKLVIGLGVYGIDWQGNSSGKELSFTKIMDLAAQNKGQIKWDKNKASPSLTYRDLDGKGHTVWFQDAATFYNQLLLSQNHGHSGYAFWRLGAEDPSIGKVLEAIPELPNPQKLNIISPVNNDESSGQGEILFVHEKSKAPSRQISIGSDGLIAAEYLLASPFFKVEKLGYTNQKKVALTFDDGPDSFYTPQILHILKKHNVKATFFVTGVDASKNPDLISKMYKEGHLIGNHTYNHQDLVNISLIRNMIELNATQRIIESITGHKTVLFRPPYISDNDPQTVEEITIILRGQSMGYLAVGNYINSLDWQRPGTKNIINNTLSQLDKGNIILFHNAGGDRRQTVEALPEIIKELKNRGYSLVTLDELLNVQRQDLMPPISTLERVLVSTTRIGYSLFFRFQWIMWRLAWLTIILGFGRLIFLFICSVIQYYQCQKKKRIISMPNSSLVSIIIAAFNEEQLIGQTVKALLNSRHQNIEIILINDGSTDRTEEILNDLAQNDRRIKIFSKPNGGKASAINLGLQHAVGKYIVTLDADTIFDPDTIDMLLRPFTDSKVAAVSGNVKVGNVINLLTLFQFIEYITGFNLERRAFDLLNCISVVPGAAGAWRKDVILQAGGYSSATLAEDTDLTIAIRKLGYKIVYEPKALAYTESPGNIKSLVKQRLRWCFGTLQCLWKHRDALFNKKYGSLGFIALPNMWIFQICFPFILPFIDILGVFLFFNNFKLFSLYFGIFYLVEILVCWYCFLLEKERKWPLILVFVQRIFYRGLICYVVLKSVWLALIGLRVGWNKLQRQGTVKRLS